MTQALPQLDWKRWRETAQHLHLVTQIIGKVRLAQTPWLNHSWHVVLYPAAWGLTTGPIPCADATLQLDLDLQAGELRLITDSGGEADLADDLGDEMEMPGGLAPAGPVELGEGHAYSLTRISHAHNFCA